jgi:hypothetical protein
MVLIDMTSGLGAPVQWMGLPATPLRLAAVVAVAGVAAVVHGLRRRARSRP